MSLLTTAPEVYSQAQGRRSGLGGISPGLVEASPNSTPNLVPVSGHT